MGSEHLQVEVSRLDGVGHVVSVSGELDYVSAPTLAAALLDVGRSIVRVDLGGLEFMDAAGVSVLLKAKRHIESEGHEFQVVNADGMIRRVFELVGLTEMLS